jgi:hypothetical protein
MDGISPGNMPLSLGDVWVGETRWGANAACAAPGVTIRAQVIDLNAAQNCIIDWPQNPWQPWGNPTAPTVVPLQHTHYHFTPLTPTPTLSDADVERIAKRVAELLIGPK